MLQILMNFFIQVLIFSYIIVDPVTKPEQFCVVRTSQNNYLSSLTWGILDFSFERLSAWPAWRPGVIFKVMYDDSVRWPSSAVIWKIWPFGVTFFVVFGASVKRQHNTKFCPCRTGLEPRRQSAGKEHHCETNPGPHGKNQEGGGVQGLAAHQRCPTGPHKHQGHCNGKLTRIERTNLHIMTIVSIQN